jgi:hypothetical protein
MGGTPAEEFIGQMIDEIPYIYCWYNWIVVGGNLYDKEVLKNGKLKNSKLKRQDAERIKIQN